MIQFHQPLCTKSLDITPFLYSYSEVTLSTQVVIPCNQVSQIIKEKTAKIIPNAVGLHLLDGRSYVFGSLLSRDATYKLLTTVYKQSRGISESDSEPPYAVNLVSKRFFVLLCWPDGLNTCLQSRKISVMRFPKLSCQIRSNPSTLCIVLGNLCSNFFFSFRLDRRI